MKDGSVVPRGPFEINGIPDRRDGEKCYFEEMSATILVPLAVGFEEIEAIVIIDLLRRANFKVITAGLLEGTIEASRRTRHLPDTTLEKVKDETFDAIVLPGGQPGTNHLKADRRLRECLVRHARDGKWIAAICAAPMVLHAAGLISGRRVTSHPSVKEQLSDTHYCEERVVVDGKLVTSRGPGTAIEFAYALVECLAGKAAVEEIERGVMAKH